MDKDVKKIISEAFDELYKDLLSEAEAGLAPKDQAAADNMAAKVRKYGDASGFSNNGASESQNNVFNYVLDKLIAEYKVTKDANVKQKIKNGIQGAFFPAFEADGRPNKTLNVLMNKWRDKDRNEVQNAAAASYEAFIKEFEGYVNRYKPGAGSNFGSVVLRALQSRVYDFIKKGNRGAGIGGTQDTYAKAGNQMGSMDDPYGDDSTLGATMADPDSIRGDSNREGALSEDQELLDIVNGWLKNNVSEKQYIAFREMTKGFTPEEVAEDNPEHFSIGKDVSRNFAQLLKRKEKDEDGNTVLALDRLSDLLSHAKKRNIDLKSIVAKNLRQTVSQDTEFSGDGKRSYVSSPETKSSLKDLSDTIYELGPDVLTKLGIKDKMDFQNGAQLSKIANKLTVMGMDDAARNIEDAWVDVKRNRANDSEYGKKIQYADKVEDGGFNAMFEGIDVYNGFDMNTLMERVMKRLSK
jgi:hypothetical protein